MPPLRSRTPDQAPLGDPPYWVAAEDLYAGDPEAGVMPVLAYRAGDRVYPDAVAAHGWDAQVRVPAEFAAQFTPPDPPPPEVTAPASQPARQQPGPPEEK